MIADYEERLASHPLGERLQEFEAYIQGHDGDTSPTMEGILQRTSRVLSFARSRLARSDPYLVTQQMLDGAANSLSKALVQYRAFDENANEAHLVQGEAQLEAVVNSLALWPAVEGPAEVEEAREAVLSFRRSVGQLLRAVQNEGAQARRDLEDLQAEFERFAQGSKQKLAELSTAVEQQKVRLDQAIAQYQELFSSSQEERSQHFERFSREQQQKQVQLLQRLTEQGDQAAEELKREAQGVLHELDEYKAQAAKLVEILGQTGVAGGYKQYADQERKSANRWRWGAVAALVTVAGIAAVALGTTMLLPFEWQRFIAKAAISVPFGFIAAYSARQSANHRENERGARKAEIELASLDPYLALFPEDERIGIKKEVAGRFFGESLSSAGPADGAVGLVEVVEALKRLAESLRGKDPDV